MRTFAAILAAGRSIRFGLDKTEELLGGKPVWRWAYDTYSSHPHIDETVLVTSAEKLERLRGELGSEALVIAGGETRQQSSLAAVQASANADVILIHDAARPFASHELITRTIEAIKRCGAAGAGLSVTDTIKETGPQGPRTLDRSRLVAMQTPQGAQVELLLKAHRQSEGNFTDELALLEALGVHPEIVEGERDNFKITSPEDLQRARRMVSDCEFRTGIGYDIHPFSDEPSRELFLGGVRFPGHRALDGHSDADVLLHAATDALLGAASLGDIGQHFPNTDPQWKNKPSIAFLTHASMLLRNEGWRVVNLDMTLIAESPKVMEHAVEIRSVVADSLGIDVSRVSVKATTNEGLGSIGRSEGIAAFASATIAR